MISDTYTNLSHDIRTPLTSLDGYFQLLRDETDKSAQEHYIDIIQEHIIERAWAFDCKGACGENVRKY